MLYELGLAATIAIGGWIAVDALLSAGMRRRSLPIACLTSLAALWAAAELLLAAADTPEERLFGRRLLFLGANFLPVAWLWLAAQAARPPWWQRRAWLVGLLALPGALLYTTMFLDGPLWFADGSSPEPRHGPLFPLYAAYSWGLGAVGLAYFARTAVRLGKNSPPRMAVLAAGVLTPILGNAAYLGLRSLTGQVLPDPTPILIGFASLLIRAAVIDAGVSISLPVGRKDVIEQLEIGILMADLEDRVVDANRAARTLLGQERLEGQPLPELLERAGRDPTRCLEVRCFPLRSHVSVVGTGAVITDRTKEEEAQRRLQLAARLESVGSLTAGIAHEVNNPLAFVRANLSQLEKLAYHIGVVEVRDLLPSPVRELASDAPELVAETADGIHRIGHIVERLLTFARDEPTRLAARPLQLAHAALKAIAMARVGLPPESIQTRFDAVPAVLARENDVVQVIMNLLVNAIHATDSRGPVELEIEPSLGGVALHVLDRGPGIAPEALPRIFDPFFTTKAAGEGTGLGLSLSYDLARQHGGRLEAANRPGGGAVFTLWLPTAPVPAAAGQAGRLESRPTRSEPEASVVPEPEARAKSEREARPRRRA